MCKSLEIVGEEVQTEILLLLSACSCCTVAIWCEYLNTPIVPLLRSSFLLEHAKNKESLGKLGALMCQQTPLVHNVAYINNILHVYIELHSIVHYVLYIVYNIYHYNAGAHRPRACTY